MAIAVPGCPDFAVCGASMDIVEMSAKCGISGRRVQQQVTGVWLR